MKSTLVITQTEMADLVKSHAGKAFRGSEIQVLEVTANLSGDHTPNGEYTVNVEVTPIERERKERKKLTDAEKLARLQKRVADAQAAAPKHVKAASAKPA